MKFKLLWWEENGYHDSYFYGVAYDDATNTLEKVGLGATAYSGGIGFDDTYALPTPEALESARKLLAQHIFETLSHAEWSDVNQPKPAAIRAGVDLRMLEDHSFYRKQTVPCPKCGGTGLYGTDRKCFSCDGWGARASKEFMKDPVTGKRVKVLIPSGKRLVAMGNAIFFGTEYRNGYNHPDRTNTFVPVFFSDHVVRIPLGKVALARDEEAPEAIRQRSEELSYSHRYGAMFGMKSWEADNWAAELQERLNESKPVAKVE